MQTTNRILDCLFIVPLYISGKASTFGAFEYTMPPLGILYMAAWLRENNYSVDLLDFSKNKRDEVKTVFYEFQKKYDTINWIGISITSPASREGYRLAALCKKIFPDALIVLGGAHVQGLKKDVLLECPEADYAIAGEGEYALRELIDGKNLKTISGLIYRSENTIFFNDFENFVDLKQMPLPAFDLIDFSGYGTKFSTVRYQNTSLGIMATRGCPYKCTFCMHMTGSKLRYTPIYKVIEQLKYFKNTLKISQISFYDDTFTVSKVYASELCRAIINEKLN